jgi:hypothetical protein
VIHFAPRADVYVELLISEPHLIKLRQRALSTILSRRTATKPRSKESIVVRISSRVVNTHVILSSCPASNTNNTDSLDETGAAFAASNGMFDVTGGALESSRGTTPNVDAVGTGLEFRPGEEEADERSRSMVMSGPEVPLSIACVAVVTGNATIGTDNVFLCLRPFLFST